MKTLKIGRINRTGLKKYKKNPSVSQPKLQKNPSYISNGFMVDMLERRCLDIEPALIFFIMLDISTRNDKNRFIFDRELCEQVTGYSAQTISRYITKFLHMEVL